MFYQYCFSDQSRQAYKLSSKVVKTKTYKAYASKVKALRNYVISKGHMAPVQIFNSALIRDHLEDIKTKGKLTQGYLSQLEASLKFVCKLNGRNLPSFVALTIKAMRMLNPRVNIPGILKLHYSPQDVNEMLYKLYQSAFQVRHNTKIYRAILIVVLSYFGMFRVSDMNRLMCKNISIQDSCMVVVSNVRKNDPYG